MSHIHIIVDGVLFNQEKPYELSTNQLLAVVSTAHLCEELVQWSRL